MTTLGDQVRAKRTVGYDYLRIVLASLVLIWHSFYASLGQGVVAEVASSPLGPMIRFIMPAFFALSGFLVTSSLERTNHLGVFLGLRGLRIFPALIVEVLLSAFILGPILTTVPLNGYFTNAEFVKYLTNTVGWIHFRLPGVYVDNPISGIVNASLWTVPFELECYIAICLLAIIGLARRPYLMAAAVIALCFASYILLGGYDVSQQVNVTGRLLVIDFLAGIVVYKLRDVLPTSPLLAIGATVASISMLGNAHALFFSPLVVAYSINAIGCTNLPHNRLLRSGDYSYGIYLYAFPIQQTVILMIGHGRPIATAVYSLAAASAFAYFSWHVIEKRALRLKTVLDRYAKVRRSPEAPIVETTGSAAVVK